MESKETKQSEQGQVSSPATVPKDEEQTEQEHPAELSVDQQTQERLKSYFKSLDPKTKLAIVTLFELQSLDGINFQAHQKEGRLMDEIWSDLESTCAETFDRKPDDDVADIPFGINDTEDIWFAGVLESVRMVIHN